MSKVSAAGLCLLAAGLAAGPAILEAQRAPTIVRFQAYPAPIVLDTLGITYEFEAPAGQVYQAVLRAADQLKLRLQTRDSARGIAGHNRWLVSGSLGGQRPSQSLDCGTGLTGPNADNQSLALAQVALIDPLGPERSRVRFALTGESRNVTGTGGPPSACHSTGMLEGRLAHLVGVFLLLPPTDKPPAPGG